MVDVDSLSDAELRSKLLEFGFPVMPITGTTRKTMAKKLKMLLENKKKVNNKDNRRSLGRYSSDDESDSEPKKTTKLKRQTMAGPSSLMQPPLTSKIAIPKPKIIEQPEKKEVKTVTTTSTRTTRILQASEQRNDEFDTGSESDEVAEQFEKESPSRYSNHKLPSSFISAASAADTAADRISQIRSRLSTSLYERPVVGNDVLEGENTPFLSNFTRRLSQLSDHKNDIIKENDVSNGTRPSPILSSYRSVRKRPSYVDYKTQPGQNANVLKNNFVPITVLIVAFLFFIVVAGVYLGIRSDAAQKLTAVIPLCVKNDANSKVNINCVLEKESKPAMNLFGVVKPELERRAVAHKCTDKGIAPFMSEEEVVEFVQKNYAVKNETKIQHDLNNLEIISFSNPGLGLGLVLFTDKGVEYHLAKDMEEVISNRPEKSTGLILTNISVPWTCLIYNTFFFCLNIISSISIGVLILYIANYSYKRYKTYKQRQHEETLSIVENIIDILQSNASENSSSDDDSYLVINHVRDMILPVSERKQKDHLWRRAVQYIAENESRIRTEVQMVRGEHAEVWRWLGGTTCNKSWQGQAFETQIGSVNSLLCSPTPCLKIRGMVDEDERNTHTIRKAVLAKCAQQCRILHCAVEPNSRCVYLKCADTGDAAVAYRNLHGWWYAGNLVTVKYLRLERYMQRFPNSPVSGPPFLQ